MGSIVRVQNRSMNVEVELDLEAVTVDASGIQAVSIVVSQTEETIRANGIHTLERSQYIPELATASVIGRKLHAGLKIPWIDANQTPEVSLPYQVYSYSFSILVAF